jgi:hypothetical protein
MGLLSTIRRGAGIGMKSLSGGGSMGSPYGILGGTAEGRNWNAEAGRRYDNSIVYACLRYIGNGFQEMAPYVRRRKGDGWDRVNNHPVELLLANCSVQGQAPWYDGTTLESGWDISENCGPGGLSFTYVHRSSAGRIVGFEYLPHFAVTPFTAPGSGNFIDYYRVALAGAYGAGYAQMEPNKDILSMRHGPINPYRLQYCVGPLEACLLEVVTDKQASLFTAALVTNIGISPHFFSPAWKDSDGNPGTINRDQWKEFLAIYDEQITGSNRGKPFGSNLPFDVTKLGFNPDEMNMDAIHNLSEERVCSSLDIHPNSIGMGTGLEQANNRASAEVAERQSARRCLKPRANRRGKQLTWFFRGQLLADDEEVYYPATENLEALQEDKAERSKRLVVACGGAYLSVNEARELDGRQKTSNPEDDEIRQTAAPVADESDEDDDDDDKAGVGAKPKGPNRPKKGKDAK